jgi:acetyl esterase/lipase
MKKLVVLIFMYLVSTNFLSAQVSIPLYDQVPNSKPSVNKEKSEISGRILIISSVSIPSLTMYSPKVTAAGKQTAVIICPGGGYGIVAAGHEGSDVAKLFNEWGIIAFVLKYRLPDDAIMIDKTIGPLQDAQRAVQIVRQNAMKWNIDPEKIGIMGFSAGGHLAATTSTHFDKAVISNPANISLRPDFSILIYPVISFTDSLTHVGSRNNLIGKTPSAEQIKDYSNEGRVNAKTPPAFLVHAKDDDAVKFGNSVAYYESLIKNKVPAELRLYENGGHGFGLNNPTTPDKWTERLKTWLKINRYIL